jgi:peptidoglycan-associated lipoprotein
MRLKFLGILAATLFITACETAPEEQMSSTSTGASSGSSSSASTSGSTSSETTAPTTIENAIVPGSQRDLVVNVGDRVYFELNRFDLDSISRGTLERQAAWMKVNGGVRVNIGGHADERGTRDYNIGLSGRRANSAKDYLVSLGVSASRISVTPFGEERPVAMGSNETAWAQNRRAETVVTGN